MPGQSVVVGFSGGLDSTVLLDVAGSLSQELGLAVSALHLNHGLSPNADRWAGWCQQVCRELAVPLTTQRVRVPLKTGEGVEAAARVVRRRALDEHSADWILLAHHADDQAETVLHNLLRGAGVRGAAAMPESRGRVLRPLLGVMRNDLRAYSRSRQLVWIEDESNADNRYTRNFLRNEILPRIASRFPRASQQLAASAGRFRDADLLLQDLAGLDLGDSPPEFPLPLKLFRDLSDSRARNLLRAMLTWHRVQAPAQRRLDEFLRQIQSAAIDRRPRLDLEGYSLWCAAGKLNFKTVD